MLSAGSPSILSSNAKKGSPLNVTPARVGSQLVPDRTSMSSRATSSSSASDGFDSFDEDEDSEELMLGTPLSQGHGGAAAGGLMRSQSEPSWDDGNSSYQIGDDSASRLIGADEERGGGGVGSMDCWEAVSSWLCCCLKKQDSPKHVFRDELKIHTRRSINFCIAIVFLSNVGFSIIMPSIWYYVQHFDHGSGCYLGLAISAFSLGQTLGSGLLSLWYEKSRHHIKLILGVSLFCILVGDLWYALSNHLWMIMVSRLLTGFGAGNQEVIQGFVASITTPEERPKHIAALSLFATFSFIVGPLLAAAFSTLDTPEDHQKFLNAWTIPGFVSALLGLVSFLLVLGIYAPRPRRHQEASEDHASEEWVDKEGPQVSMVVTLALIVAYFFIFTTGSVYETIVVPFTDCSYEWTLLENAGLFAVAGFFSALTFACMICADSLLCTNLCRKVGIRRSSEGLSAKAELLLLIPALVVLAAGYGIMISSVLLPGDCVFFTLPLWRFLLGSVFITFTFPFSFSGVVNLFSRLLAGKSARYITFRMRMLKAGGYLARMIAPLWSGCVFEYRGFDIIFLVTSVGVVFATVLILLFSHYLVRTIHRINSSM